MTTIHALIIDDNQLNGEVLTVILQNENVNVTTVSLPRNLPEVIKEIPRIDIVFLDLEFPNDDGFELLQSLRTYETLTDVPIVAYTVHTSEIERARQAGFDGFIGKPIDTRRFPEQLARLLSGEAVWEA